MTAPPGCSQAPSSPGRTAPVVGKLLSLSPGRLASFAAPLAISAMIALSGCGHRRSYSASAPTTASQHPPPVSAESSRTLSSTPIPPSAVSTQDQEFIAAHSPIYSEQGVASWYGPPYHNRVGANGQVVDQNVMTAAHRTLPMGSLIVVTNEKSGQSATMRVTDRGPFVQGRVLDLSMASAKATGVYRAGLAQVRIDVYETPRPIEAGGRWCVQIGAFEHQHKAVRLHEELERSYQTARVIDFAGPTGYWVRIRPQGDDRRQAELIARSLKPEEGDAYLVRLD